MKGILGQKVGMTQVFTKDGTLIPVTVVDVKENVVTQVKTIKTDNYNSIQLSVGEQKKQRLSKSKLGHYQKAQTTPKRFTKEIKNMVDWNLGAKVKVSEIFSNGELVDVTGISKGKGFAGVIKRHNASQGPMSHGSQFHRQIGSMSDIEGNKIQKGKKMPGQMGNVKKTIQNLEIIEVDDQKNYLLIKGSIPGINKSYVIVKSAIKGLSSQTPKELFNYKEEKLEVVKKELKTKEEKISPQIKSNSQESKEKQVEITKEGKR